MKYIGFFDVEVSDLCEWVKDAAAENEKNPNFIVNVRDLDNDMVEYIRVGEIADDEEVGLIKDRMTPIDRINKEDWIPFDNLSYSRELGLMW